MSKQRKFLLVFSAIGFISMFLPWVSNFSFFGYTESANGMHREGIVVFICFIVTGFIAFIDDQKKNLGKSAWTITLITDCIALLIIIWYFLVLEIISPGSAFVGFGLYIAAIAAIVILFSTYLLRSQTDNIKEGFESLKEDLKSKFADTTTTVADSDKIVEAPENIIEDKENSNP